MLCDKVGCHLKLYWEIANKNTMGTWRRDEKKRKQQVYIVHTQDIKIKNFGHRTHDVKNKKTPKGIIGQSNQNIWF